MKITVAKQSGFCFGVRRAVDEAKRLAAKQCGRPFVMFGEIVHNPLVVSELISLGFSLAHTPDEIKEPSVVVIRAHGISPSVRCRLEKAGHTLIDRTCPFVEKVQKLAEQAAIENRDLIIAGRPDHPEVEGVLGFYTGQATVLNNAAEAKTLPISDRETILIAQTTFSTEKFVEITNILSEKIAKLKIFDTICSTTASRQVEASGLARESDLMLVLGSPNSSNTGKLVEVCKAVCAETYLVESTDDVRLILSDRNTDGLSVGITAGASTPERMIGEVIQFMTENEGLMNNQQDTQELDFSEFVDNIPQLKKGSIVKGAIVRYDDDFVYVDVKDKSEGRIPKHEFAGDVAFDLDAAVENHQEIDVYVRNIRNTDHGKEISLSKTRVEYARDREYVEKAFNEKTPVLVRVKSVVKDGVLAAYGNIDIYVHRTQIEPFVVKDLEPYLGQQFEIQISNFEPHKRRLRVSGSRRALIQKERRRKAAELWATMEVGEQYEGIVRNLTDFGAFVDLGGVDGLVHISELSWGRIKHPSEVVQVGDRIPVFVKDFDPERKRVSLGYRRQEMDPYRDVEERFPIGSIVRGIVVRIFQFGVFIEIAPGVDALCHISQISDYRLQRPNDVIEVGMEVDARVIEVSNQARRISVSIRDVEPINPIFTPETEPPPRPGRRRDRDSKRRSDDELPTSYSDRQPTSSLADMATITFTSDEHAEAVSEIVEGLNAGPSDTKAVAEESAEEVVPDAPVLQEATTGDESDVEAGESGADA
jgi:small subunit ribosomal protein S1